MSTGGEWSRRLKLASMITVNLSVVHGEDEGCVTGRCVCPLYM